MLVTYMNPPSQAPSKVVLLLALVLDEEVRQRD